MGERVKQLSSAPAGGRGAVAPEDLDAERVAKVLPVLSTLLGVRIDEVR
jgi:hypothetical protein